MDTSFSALLQFSLASTLPIFIMLFLGMFLGQRGKLSPAFIQDANQLIYTMGLPVMLFISCAGANVDMATGGDLMSAFAIMTLGIFFTAWALARKIAAPQDVGVLVQGSFRGNLVILGLALAASTFGSEGVAMATLPVAFTVVIYNILSVFILAERPNAATTLKSIISNPLILAIAAGWAYNLSGFPLPQLLTTSAGYITQMVLPLALICIGASLTLEKLLRIDGASLIANGFKLVLSPLLASCLGWWLGLRGDALVVLFLLASAPTATVSFVMAKAQGANATLAAAIIAQTTFFSLFTVTAGLMLLSKIAY